ncbi:MAG: peptide deformylase [Bacteroidales bacterium]|jgi:peptide deformylase|nr:peptide deformylase [Bacteroidales bacterium]
MILPIVGYGSPVLRTVAKDIDKNYPDLKKLVDDMFETMYKASGVGLAAPQIDLSIRLFVIDASPMKESDPLADGFKRVFINPQIIEERGDLWSFQEGCLSLPDIHEEVSRPSIIKIKYFDEDFLEHEEELDGIRARVFQHEFDHIQGKVFVDRLSSIRRTLLKRKLNDISSGRVRTDYKMKTLKKGR